MKRAGGFFGLPLIAALVSLFVQVMILRTFLPTLYILHPFKKPKRFYGLAFGLMIIAMAVTNNVILSPGTPDKMIMYTMLGVFNALSVISLFILHFVLSRLYKKNNRSRQPE